MFGIAKTADSPTDFLKEFGIAEENLNDNLKLLAQTNSRYLKDLKINVNNALQAVTLVKKEAYLLAFAVAINEKNAILEKAFSTQARAEGATDEEIAEIISCTSLLNANNVYYRFRHFLKDDYYTNAQAGIRMNIMANPVLGKEFFELTSLVVSALNGCELCVTSHEKTLLAHGTNKQRIHDAVRLGAVIRSLGVLL
ncbi:MAG TPA: carboxymuconolactone decarboxylase family protein [Flavitalea sp.]|nr:carboxymuconolactone decarboxylase family protein [Flavitalea sp.]